jgi:hypothetical protein
MSPSTTGCCANDGDVTVASDAAIRAAGRRIIISNPSFCMLAAFYHTKILFLVASINHLKLHDYIHTL